MKIKGNRIKGKLMFAHNCLFTNDGLLNEQNFYLLQSADGTVSVVQTATLTNGKKVYSRRQDACKSCGMLPQQMIEQMIQQNRSWDKIEEGRYEIFD